MNKLNRYNQKLLAIIGTTIIAIAAIALLIAIGSSIFLLISSNYDRNDNDGIRIQQTAKSDSSDTIVRTQEITFNTPIQLDSANTKFIIPIGQVNLKVPERVGSDERSFKRMTSSNYEYGYSSDLHNNFILYDNSNNSSKKIFEAIVAITYWTFLKVDNSEVLLFKGSNADDNKDGQIDYGDYQSLYAYYIEDEQLIHYSFEHKTVQSFHQLSGTHLIAIGLGIDKDKDFYFNSSVEPREVITLDLSSRKIKEIVPLELIKEIQGIIDGTQN